MQRDAEHRRVAPLHPRRELDPLGRGIHQCPVQAVASGQVDRQKLAAIAVAIQLGHHAQWLPRRLPGDAPENADRAGEQAGDLDIASASETLVAFAEAGCRCTQGVADIATLTQVAGGKADGPVQAAGALAGDHVLAVKQPGAGEVAEAHGHGRAPAGFGEQARAQIHGLVSVGAARVGGDRRNAIHQGVAQRGFEPGQHLETHAIATVRRGAVDAQGDLALGGHAGAGGLQQPQPHEIVVERGAVGRQQRGGGQRPGVTLQHLWHRRLG